MYLLALKVFPSYWVSHVDVELRGTQQLFSVKYLFGEAKIA